jgi:hypothetical protein
MAGPIKSVSKKDHLERGGGTSKPKLLSKKAAAAAATRPAKAGLTGDWLTKQRKTRAEL